MRNLKLKKITESIKGSKKENVVDIIHDAAESINARIMKDMKIKDNDFIVRYTPYGLWITWNSNDYYGIRVGMNEYGNIEVRSQQDHDAINDVVLEWQSHPSRIASAVMYLVEKDGEV